MKIIEWERGRGDEKREKQERERESNREGERERERKARCSPPDKFGQLSLTLNVRLKRPQ